MKTIVRDQYLTFDGVKLISVYSDEFPFDQERCKEMWYIPGRRIMATGELIGLAVVLKVSLNRTTCDKGVVTTTNII